MHSYKLVLAMILSIFAMGSLSDAMPTPHPATAFKDANHAEKELGDWDKKINKLKQTAMHTKNDAEFKRLTKLIDDLEAEAKSVRSQLRGVSLRHLESEKMLEAQNEVQRSLTDMHRTYDQVSNNTFAE